MQAARRLTKRAFRARESRFLAEGRRRCARRSAGPGTVTELFVTREAAERHPELLGPAAEQGVPVQLVSGEVMSAIAQTVTPQGVVAVCRTWTAPSTRSWPRPRLVAVLAHARDPGNAGTVLRTADAAGADAVLLTGDSVDPYNPKCVRASAGSLFHLPVVVGREVAQDLPALRGRVSGPGRRRARRPRPGPGRRPGAARRPTAWVFGNEAWGLPAGDPRAGRPGRPGADPRAGREPQPGHRRGGLPLRIRLGPARPGRGGP